MKCFSITAVGATETIVRDGQTTEIPARKLSPRGYEEVFTWIIKRYKQRKTRGLRIAALVAVTVLVFGLLALGVNDWVTWTQAIGTLDDPKWPSDWLHYENNVLAKYLTCHPDKIHFTDYGLIKSVTYQ